jgi:RNA polymerase II C-terminal domain phosphatase-like 1/2
MLNLRCLGIVFDFDETLIVANTSRHLRIELMRLKESRVMRLIHSVGMVQSEIKRYQDDKSILKHVRNRMPVSLRGGGGELGNLKT